MAEIALFLASKYGLTQAPSNEQTDEWAVVTEQLILSGHDREKAAERAARQVFPDLFRS